VLHAKLRNRTCQGLDRQGQGQGLQIPGQGQGQGLDLQGQGQGQDFAYFFIFSYFQAFDDLKCSTVGNLGS